MAKKVKSEYEELHETPIEDIAKGELEETPEIVETPEEKEEKVDIEEVAKKTAEETARKAADEFEAKLKKIDEDKRLSEETREKRKEELKANWSGKAEDGTAVPKDYDEIAAEAVRIAEEKIMAKIEAREAEREEKARQERESQEKQKADTEAQNKQWVEEQQKLLDEEFEELYKQDLIKRPISDDPNDPSNKERQSLINLGIKVNTERIAKGLQPINSITRIYYNYYKKESPGATAPIAGNRPATMTPTNDGFVYARDHNKSFAQLRAEAAARGEE